MFRAAYRAPSSLKETSGFLGDTNHLSIPFAGGTQLLVDLHILTEMATYFGNPLIRVAATLGGNGASSYTQVTDAVVPLLALDAMLLLQSSKGEDCHQRTLRIDECVQPVNNVQKVKGETDDR